MRRDEAQRLPRDWPPRAGKLDADEVALALDELELDPAQLDEFYAALDEAQIAVVHADEEAESGRPRTGRRDHERLVPALLQDIRRVPLLTAVEEVELAKRIERGDHGAKQRMIESNLRLVVSIAKRYRDQGCRSST